MWRRNDMETYSAVTGSLKAESAGQSDDTMHRGPVIRLTTRKISKLSIISLLQGTLPVNHIFPLQRAVNAEKISISRYSSTTQRHKTLKLISVVYIWTYRCPRMRILKLQNFVTNQPACMLFTMTSHGRDAASNRRQLTYLLTSLLNWTTRNISNFSINGILGWVSTGDLKITLTKHTLGYVDSLEWKTHMFTYFTFVAPEHHT